jgi:hypothetical protein
MAENMFLRSVPSGVSCQWHTPHLAPEFDPAEEFRWRRKVYKKSIRGTDGLLLSGQGARMNVHATLLCACGVSTEPFAVKSSDPAQLPKRDGAVAVQYGIQFSASMRMPEELVKNGNSKPPKVLLRSEFFPIPHLVVFSGVRATLGKFIADARLQHEDRTLLNERKVENEDELVAVLVGKRMQILVPPSDLTITIVDEMKWKDMLDAAGIKAA